MKLKNICMMLCLFATQLSFATSDEPQLPKTNFTTACKSKLRSTGRGAVIFGIGLLIGKYYPEFVDQTVAVGSEVISDLKTVIRNGYNKIKPKNLFESAPTNSECGNQTPELENGKTRATVTLEHRTETDPDNGQQ